MFFDQHFCSVEIPKNKESNENDKKSFIWATIN